MELIGNCYTLNEEQQKQYANREVKKIAVIFGSVFIVMTVLLFVLKAPSFLLGSIIPLILIIFLIVLVVRYFVMEKMASGYQLCFDEDKISATFNKEKVGTVVTGMSQLSEARHGTHMNQRISWENIDYITINENGIKIFSTKYDVMNGNGKIEIPSFVDDYEMIKTFFETRYSKKINK